VTAIAQEHQAPKPSFVEKDPMTNLFKASNAGHLSEGLPTRHGGREQRSVRISVPEIAERLDIGRQAVYAMLEQGIMPGIRVGRRWIVTRHAYESWERTCGMRERAGLAEPPEVKVLN